MLNRPLATLLVPCLLANIVQASTPTDLRDPFYGPSPFFVTDQALAQPLSAFFNTVVSAPSRRLAKMTRQQLKMVLPGVPMVLLERRGRQMMGILLFAAMTFSLRGQPASSYQGALREGQIAFDHQYISRLLGGTVEDQRSALRKLSDVHRVKGFWTPEFQSVIVHYLVSDEGDPALQRSAEKTLIADHGDPERVVDELDSLARLIPKPGAFENPDTVLRPLEQRQIRLEALLERMHPQPRTLNDGKQSAEDLARERSRYRKGVWSLRFRYFSSILFLLLLPRLLSLAGHLNLKRSA